MAVEIFLKPQVVDFRDVGKAVEVNMVQGEIASIFPDYYEGRTEGIFLDAQPFANALNEAGLTSSQLTDEKEDIALLG
jgi:hypothetical protein